ncbi:MAG: phosphoenolpyruvate carboxylase [Bacteroidia bacterium]|nr:phosphoenolpyruvate carboxylase [Bacteroidia bacterium]
MTSRYDQAVTTRYHIYNSLFLNLPFRKIYRTGTLLPLLQQDCIDGFEAGKNPTQIINDFFNDYAPTASKELRFEMLFRFIQYVERQVVLFDSLEDASFAQINDLTGKGTLSALLLQASSGEALANLKEKLDKFSVRVVLTAHPTQFYPGPVLAIITDLEDAIRDNNVEHINLLLQQLGKTAFFKREKPTPFDEAISLCWYLEYVFYKAIPAIIKQLADGINIPIIDWKNNHLVRIGFWPGGDRDGNPFVTHQITLKVAQHVRTTILRCYHRDLRFLKRRLTFKGVDVLITEAEQRTYQTLVGGNNSYQHADDLEQQLLLVREILQNEHDGLFLDQLDNFIIKLRAFGFYFTSLDVRQDSRKHHQLWQYIVGMLHKKNIGIKESEFNSLDENAQIEHLLKISIDPVFLDVDDLLMEEMIRSFKAIQTIQQLNGELGCHRYVISNCGSALNVIEVFKLAQLLVAHHGELLLDIVPLFESIDDLDNAHEVMRSLYSIPAYRDHLKLRENKQTIMLGFSDGTKDGGYLRANWSIFRAKEELSKVSREFGLVALFFDGRGGPPARGGGNTHDFYASLGNTIENEEVQITIQGQTISSNYGKVVSCKYNLEQMISAGVESSVFPERVHSFSPKEKELLDDLANAGYESYLTLKNHPKFVPYLEKVTPLPFFGATNIGSRPVKRSQAQELKLEDLRAIPFVGSWAQMKQNIPGFFGVGTAIEKLKKNNQLKEIQSLYRKSLFFRTLLGNSMMSLTKSFYPATAHLSKDEEFGEIWDIMFAEFNLSKTSILEASDLPELMENNTSIRDSIRLRERIVLPLITIQQYALQQLRNPTEANKVFEKEFKTLALRCMFGIINAARNSA